MEAINARWQEFEDEHYAGQWDLFMKTLNEPELMDDEMAFEMLGEIYKQTIDHNERDRFEASLLAFRDRLP